MLLGRYLRLGAFTLRVVGSQPILGTWGDVIGNYVEAPTVLGRLRLACPGLVLSEL